MHNIKTPIETNILRNGNIGFKNRTNIVVDAIQVPSEVRSSFAFKLPYAAVDGNVIRFIGRFFGEEAPYDTYQGRKIYSSAQGKNQIN